MHEKKQQKKKIKNVRYDTTCWTFILWQWVTYLTFKIVDLKRIYLSLSKLTSISTNLKFVYLLTHLMNLSNKLEFLNVVFILLLCLYLNVILKKHIACLITLKISCMLTIFTAQRYAKRGICRRRVCVCVCVRHTPVLYQNG